MVISTGAMGGMYVEGDDLVDDRRHRRITLPRWWRLERTQSGRWVRPSGETAELILNTMAVCRLGRIR
jgi:hypothetical protein